MKSATAVTYELDNIPVAAAALAGQIRGKIEIGEESVGILYGQPDMELGELASLLRETLGFPIIGGTTAAAALLSNEGYHEMAVMLHVMTAEDCFFSVAISPPLTEEPQRRIVGTYNEALAKLQGKGQSLQPKFVFCIMPLLENYSSDNSLSVLSEAVNGLPVFGFVAADDFDFSNQQVFLNGAIGGDRLALLLIAGNINPVFEVKNLAGSQTLSKKRVTKAHDNIICEIEGKPAYEYITEFPFIEEEAGVLWNYQFFVEMQNEADNDGVLVSRALNSYNKETGEISCFANVPQESDISLLYCDHKSVKDSCGKALKAIHDKIRQSEQPGCQYTTVFIASCSLRSMFLANEKDVEGNMVRETLPPGLVVSGVYAFGEIAPTSIRNNKAVNRFHNATMTICAI